MKKHIVTLTSLFFCTAIFAGPNISPKDALKHVGDNVTVCGKTSGTRKDATKSTLILVGSGSATSQMNIIINQIDIKNFPYKPGEYLINKNVCVSGKVLDQNGKPEITVRGPEFIKVNDDVTEVDIRPLSFDGLNRYFEE